MLSFADDAPADKFITSKCTGISGETFKALEKFCLDDYRKAAEANGCIISKSQSGGDCKSLGGASVSCTLKTENCYDQPRNGGSLNDCPSGYEEVSHPEPNKEFQGRVMSATCRKKGPEPIAILNQHRTS